MSPLPIVKLLDIFSDLRDRFLPGEIFTVMSQLVFERAEETLHRGIVVVEGCFLLDVESQSKHHGL